MVYAIFYNNNIDAIQRHNNTYVCFCNCLLTSMTMAFLNISIGGQKRQHMKFVQNTSIQFHLNQTNFELRATKSIYRMQNGFYSLGQYWKQFQSFHRNGIFGFFFFIFFSELQKVGLTAVFIIVTSAHLSQNGPELVDVEPQPSYDSYKYTPTENGYNYRFVSVQNEFNSKLCANTFNKFFSIRNSLYSYSTSNSIFRDESIEIHNKGTRHEQLVLYGVLRFTADDSYMYAIQYSYDKNGRNVTLDYYAFNRIPPGVLKSLVG